MKWAWLVAVAILASGCHSKPPSIDPPGQSISCVGSGEGQVCLADPASRDATYVRETYGLEQLTNDPKDEQGNIRVDGDWIVWQIASAPYDADIVAYNLATKQLMPVEISGTIGSQSPFLHNGEVVFQRFSGDEPFGYLAHWNSTTGKVTHPETGLNGSTPYGFDGTWVGLQGVTNDGTQNGFFAWNMHDGRLIHLYTPLPGNKKPDGTSEGMKGFRIEDGKAYYLLSRAKAPDTGFSATIYEVDLETRQERSWDFPDGGTQMAVDGNYVIFGSNLTIQALDTNTGQFRKISQDGESGCGFPSVGQDLVVFRCSRPRSAAWAFDLATGQRMELAGENLSAWQAVTDGRTVVVEALRNLPEHYETFYSDLYYKRLT